MKWKMDSMISMTNKLAIIFSIVFLAYSAQAAVIEFEADEIPSESVLPVLDSNMAVKKKQIPLNGRLELGFLYGSVIDEMFYNNLIWGLQFLYNIDDESAVGLKYGDHLNGKSSYAEQFESTSARLNFDKAPAPGRFITASYRWTFLYGKMSLSKNLVLPTLFSTESDLGILQVGGQNLPYGAVGVTHKMVIKKQWGIGLSYRLLVYQTLNPVSVSIRNSSPTPQESDFEKKLQISQSLDLALSYLF